VICKVRAGVRLTLRHVLFCVCSIFLCALWSSANSPEAHCAGGTSSVETRGIIVHNWFTAELIVQSRSETCEMESCWHAGRTCTVRVFCCVSDLYCAYMMYLLTAIGLSPGGSSTVHIYTQTIHRTTQITTEQHK